MNINKLAYRYVAQITELERDKILADDNYVVSAEGIPQIYLPTLTNKIRIFLQEDTNG